MPAAIDSTPVQGFRIQAGVLVDRTPGSAIRCGFAVGPAGEVRLSPLPPHNPPPCHPTNNEWLASTASVRFSTVGTQLAHTHVALQRLIVQRRKYACRAKGAALIANAAAMASVTAASRPKLYFAGSIRGGREDAALYMRIIQGLADAGNEVLTEHVGKASLDMMGEGDLTEQQIFERDMAWLRSSDVVVAECTVPSLGVGYELGLAESLGIPVLVLFRPAAGRSLSAMLRGNVKFAVHEYAGVDSELFAAIAKFMEVHRVRSD